MELVFLRKFSKILMLKLFFFRIRSFVSWVIINSDVTRFINPVDVELGARYLIHDDDIDYCDQVYKNLRNKFENSILFHLFWSSHLFVVSKTPLKALLVLDSVIQKKKFLISFRLLINV